MNAKVIVIFTFSVLYGLFEFLMSRRGETKTEIKEKGDKGSIWILILGISAGYWLSFIIASTKAGRIYHWNTLFIIGFILVAAGLIIRVSSIITLKKQFTYRVTKIENHQLIETGLYKYIRHPGYSGQLIIFSGIAIALSNWLSILLMIIPVLAVYLNRIRVEEQFMVLQMGQTYIDYRNRTKKLIPGIF